MNRTAKRKGLGWRADLPDVRDQTFVALRREITIPPEKVDLRSSFPDPYDQGSLGSCTAQAVGAICDFKYGMQSSFHPSALFLYFRTRVLEGTVQYDSGATIRNTIKAVNRSGICHEDRWPYKVSQFAKTPPRVAYTEAAKHQALKYRRVEQALLDMKIALANDLPIAFGFSVYPSFYDLSPKDYTIKYPGPDESVQGGHAVVIVGYDDSLKAFTIRNSWGKNWANQGHFLMPYDFIVDRRLCSDFWTIEIMEGE